MTTLNEKIRDIISTYKLSDRQFAIKIGVTQSVIGSMFQKGTLAAFPEISADWFLRDAGEMLKSQSKEMERINSLLDTISTLQDTINAKSDQITILTERIKQLENQLGK